MKKFLVRFSKEYSILVYAEDAANAMGKADQAELEDWDTATSEYEVEESQE